MIKRTFITAIVVIALISLIAPTTYAVPTLQLSDGVTTITIADGSVIPGAVDSNPLVGVVTYIGGIGAGTWTVNVTTGITKPAIGDPVQAKMDLNSIDVSSLGAGSLNIQFSETNFGPSTGRYLAEIGGTIANLPGSSLTYDTYYDFPGNALFAMTTPITSQGAFIPGAFSGSTSTAVGGIPAPHSLTQDVTIVHTGNGTTSFNASLSVPEPSSAFLLLGLLLCGIGFLQRKKED
jgi:hypothetical protein